MDWELERVSQAASFAFAVVFVLSLPARLWKVGQYRNENTKNRLRYFMAALGITLTAMWLLNLIYISSRSIQHRSEYMISFCVTTLATIGLSLLLFQGGQRSYRDSRLTKLYLFVSIICDIVFLKTSSWISSYSIISRSVLTRCCVYLTFLVLDFISRGHTETGVSITLNSTGELGGISSTLLFMWTNKGLFPDFRNTFSDEVLPPLSEDLKSEYTRSSIRSTWSQRAKPETKYSLPLALIQSLKVPFLAAVIPRLCLIAFRYSQPILIRQTIKYAAAPAVGIGSSRRLLFVLFAVTIYIGLAWSTAIYRHRIDKLKLMTRSSLIGLIHDKTLRSASSAYDNGETTTLMSTDAESLENVAEMVHETWAQVVEVLIGLALLASEVGWIWPLPLVLIYLCSHMSRFVARNLQPRQKDWNNATQNRIAATSNALSSIKSVKLLGMRQSLTDRITDLRKQELISASKLRWIMVNYNASANALGIFSPAITVAVFALLSKARGSTLGAETAFTTMTVLTMVTHPANMIMTIVPRAVTALAGFERIQSFLLKQPLQVRRVTPSEMALDNSIQKSTILNLPQPQFAVQVSELKIGYDQPILEGINLDIPGGSFTVLSGPTGSGKSTLLRTIIGEISPTRGSINLSTRKIAYCAQKPWLPNGTIKEAIYGAKKAYEPGDQGHDAWYNEITKICCLDHDFEKLPGGDQTQIGSRGLNLSGGQRQRVTLARALFAKYDILLLDDIFSGLDDDTKQIIFQNIFGLTGLIRRLKTTTILVSNLHEHIQAADHVVIMENHKILDQGNWQNIQIKADLSTKLSSGSALNDKTCLAAKHENLDAQLRAMEDIGADLQRQSGDCAIYGYYFGFIDTTNIFLLVAATAAYSFFISVPQYWLRLWTEFGGLDISVYIVGFLFLSTMSWAATSTQMWSVLIRLAPQSGSRIHQRLLHIVMNAPLSYYTGTDNGSILNRFSQDIQIIDKQLPSALQTVTTQLFKLLMQIILLCLVEKRLLLSLPACTLLVCVMQKVYLRISRQLQFFEMESRAEVFSNFLESVEGLETIRSFDWSNAVMLKSIISVDNSQRPEFLSLCIQRWLNILLDLLSSTFAITFIVIAVLLQGRISGAQVGIALNTLLVANSTLLRLIDSWTTLETFLGAVARVKSLQEVTPAESAHGESIEPPKDWPSRGKVEFENATASYHPDSMAVHNLNLNIASGQKLIICGRTGSGKSTIISTLLRLLELQSGKIRVDGVDIKQVDLDILRQRCFITVSQDPLILPNETLRFNLNPDNSASDNDVFTSLKTVGLHSHFVESERGEVNSTAGMPELDNGSVLDRKVAQFRELSAGQCQLFAVCRALVKLVALQNSGVRPVILLDEVTSSLDHTTESTIFDIIDKEFTSRGHTIILITHRFNILKDHVKTGRDALAVIANGQIQEVIKNFGPATFQDITCNVTTTA